jgi:signal transduction histidine kinase/ligand-binding sensor domain-containing protein
MLSLAAPHLFALVSFRVRTRAIGIGFLARLVVAAFPAFLFLETFPSTSYAQTKEFRITNYSIINGLPTDMIKMTWQDAQGFVWIATDAGIVRFDGRRAITSTELPSLYVKGVMQPAKRGHNQQSLNPSVSISSVLDHPVLILTDLGIVAADEGLSRLNVFTLGASQRSDTTIFRPKSWYEDKHGTLWLGEPDAIVRLAPSGSIARRYAFAEAYWSDHFVRSFVFAEDHAGHFYAAPQRGATLFQYNQGADAFVPLAMPPPPFSRISALLVRPNGALWLGTDKGVFELDGVPSLPQHQWRWKRVAAQREVSCLAQDSSSGGKPSCVYVGTWYDGLYRLRADNTKGNLEGRATSEKLSIVVSNTINDIRTSADGSLWISTDDGLKLLQPAALHQFRSVFARPYIQVVTSDANGSVLATDGIHLLRFSSHRPSASMEAARENTSENVSENVGEKILTVPDNAQGIAMSVMRRGDELLYGSSLGGVYSVRGSQVTKRAQLQATVAVFALCRTPDGSLWASQDLPEGITRIAPNGAQTLYGAARGLASQSIVLRTTPNGTLFAGGRGKAYLSRYDAADDRFINISAALPFDNRAVPRVSGAELVVSDMAASGDTVLWLATNMGLLKYHIGRASIDSVPLSRDMARRPVQAVRVLASGVVVFTTNQQAHQYLPSGQLLSTDLYIGTTAMTSTARNLAVDAQGTIWVGATQGLLAIESSANATRTTNTTNTVRTTRTTPTPVFVKLKCNDSLTRHLPVSALHLASQHPTGTFIAAEFAALTYPAERVRYQTRLLEAAAPDSSWSESSFDGEVLLPSLKAGTYTLHVRAQQTGMLWSEPAELRFVIVAPWYVAWWAWCLYVLWGGGLLYGVSKWRSRRLEQKNLVLKRIVAERTAEIERQLVILDEQARSIELTNTQLQEQNVALQELNNEKNEFLGMAAHDLKNPLTTIMMSSSMINRYAKDMKPEDIASQMQSVERTAKRMRDIITNLLDINAIEMGKFKFDLQPVNASGSISDLVTVYRVRAAEKNITLHFEPPTEEIWVRADETALTEIVENIVSNALKYSPPDKNVWVTIVGDQLMPNMPHEAGFPSARRALVAVRDEGPGLTEEDMSKLFTKFGRLSAKPTGGEHSTGLGLSIVKRMVEAMNGRVWCESQMGQGATFIVEFPQESPPHDASNAAPAHVQRNTTQESPAQESSAQESPAQEHTVQNTPA